MLNLFLKASIFLALTTLSFAQPSKREYKDLNKAFLKENSSKTGITTTKSGLQYEVLVKGQSTAIARNRDTVELHFHGTLLDGTVFESSIAAGKPLKAKLSKLIIGWREGIKLMSPGDKYRFFIPSHLAYGSEKLDKIPPYSTLTFEIELLSIQAK